MNEMELLARLRDEVPAGVISARAETVLRDALEGKGASASSGLRRPWAQARWLASSWRLGRGWSGWLAPLAAAAAVAAVIVGTPAILGAIRGTPPASRAVSPPSSPPVTFPASLDHRATVFVVDPGVAHHTATDRVIPIRAATNRALRPVRTGNNPGAIAITPNGQVAYVANLYSASVTPIRVATGTALPAIKVGYWPDAIAITPDGKTGYVADSEARGNKPSGPLKAGDTVTPFRVATNTALRPVKTGNNPGAIAITPDGRTAYVANQGSGTVTPIRVATNTALPPIRVGVIPAAMAVTPDGKTIYVAGLEGEVVPIRVATNTALPPIEVGRYPQAIAITPDSQTAYVVNFQSASVTPIRVATNTALPPITVGRTPQAIAITPDGRTAYVVNSASASVTPIRVATNTALPPVKVGGFPIGIAIAAGHN